MSKLTIGLAAAGATLASAAALSVFVGSGNATHDATLTAGAAGASTSSAARGGAAAAGGSIAPDVVNIASATTASKTVLKAPLKEVKPVRSVNLQLPTEASKVGSNVTGSIQVLDTAGKLVTPVEGAVVALQQKRGAVFVTLSDGLTDPSGLFPVSFTSTANSTWRAQLTLPTGAKLYSAIKSSIASASVTWASRPDMDLPHGVASTYSFRVNSTSTATGHLEIANSLTPTKWVALKGVAVSATGVITQDETFPSAGTWLLRGATAATATNGAGYTTSITVKVS